MLLCKVDVDKHYFSSPFYYETGLMVAAKRGFTDIVSELANKTNKIDYQLREYSALMLAAKNGHHQAVSILLEHGANLNAKNIFKQNALCIAVENCHGPVVSVLLENGADPQPNGKKKVKENKYYLRVHNISRQGMLGNDFLFILGKYFVCCSKRFCLLSLCCRNKCHFYLPIAIQKS